MFLHDLSDQLWRMKEKLLCFPRLVSNADWNFRGWFDSELSLPISWVATWCSNLWKRFRSRHHHHCQWKYICYSDCEQSVTLRPHLLPQKQMTLKCFVRFDFVLFPSWLEPGDNKEGIKSGEIPKIFSTFVLFLPLLRLILDRHRIKQIVLIYVHEQGWSNSETNNSTDEKPEEILA